MNKMASFIAVSLLGLAVVSTARANSIVPAPGETLDATITGTQTGGPNCCETGTFDAEFTLVSMIGATEDWTVTGFNIVSGGLDTSSTGCFFGSTPCSQLVWTLSSNFLFDASNDTLDGTAATPFTGTGGGSREATLFFVDGVTSNLNYTNDKTLDPTKDKPGVFSYSISAVAVPEPSSFLLLSCGALGLAGMLRRKFWLRILKDQHCST